MSDLLSAKGGLPVAVEGKGVYLKTATGRWLLDGSSGALAASLGHGRQDLSEILRQQAASLAFVHRTQLRNEPVEKLAALLREVTPGPLTKSAFVSSGSDAIEMAIRLAITYAASKGEPRHAVIAAEHCYHGVTLGALALTSRPSSKRALESILMPVHRFDRSLEGLLRVNDSSPSASTPLIELGFEDAAAVIVEVVAGGSGGVLIPEVALLEDLRRRCDASGALLIFDEVMTGFGRTGRGFALEHFGVIPDVLVFGKGMSGGYGPVAGLIATSDIAAQVQGFGGVGLGHTYMNTPLMAMIALATSEIIFEPSFLTQVDERGKDLLSGLSALMEGHSCISGVRGLGLMAGIDFVDDRGAESATHTALIDRVLKACLDADLLLYPATPRVTSSDRATVIAAPPLIISEGEVAELIERLDRAASMFGKP